MIETFKIITGIYDKRVTKDICHLSRSTTTRGIISPFDQPKTGLKS